MDRMKNNVEPFVPGTRIRGIAVGNEVLGGSDQELWEVLLLAVKNIHTALDLLHLYDDVEVSSPHSAGVFYSFTVTDVMQEIFPGWDCSEKLVTAKQTYGREIRVFEKTTATISQTSDDVSEETDDLEFTTVDYYRILATKKEDKYLKTKKIRDAEAAASRSRITKPVIRIRFPDNHTLEATFHPTETMQSLIDLLVKVVARPDLPFYINTIPPKKQIKNMS
ncbi:unnamed protein product [Lactuca virosa]|uniref:UBX domain-containing protein n=1 Tax=Lactuca virosa TaxID=75947 RepID=A0AAU9NSR9_9ASTR|nr:unnamed protein product [Lactuca virosa]